MFISEITIRFNIFIETILCRYINNLNEHIWLTQVIEKNEEEMWWICVVLFLGFKLKEMTSWHISSSIDLVCGK